MSNNLTPKQTKLMDAHDLFSGESFSRDQVYYIFECTDFYWRLEDYVQRRIEQDRKERQDV